MLQTEKKTPAETHQNRVHWDSPSGGHLWGLSQSGSAALAR